jgi:hypothetical protein
VPFGIPVPLVELSYAVPGRVPNARNRTDCPIRREVGPPGRPPLDDRHSTLVDDGLDSDLVEHMGWNPLVTVSTHGRKIDSRWLGHDANRTTSELSGTRARVAFAADSRAGERTCRTTRLRIVCTPRQSAASLREP